HYCEILTVGLSKRPVGNVYATIHHAPPKPQRVVVEVLPASWTDEWIMGLDVMDEKTFVWIALGGIECRGCDHLRAHGLKFRVPVLAAPEVDDIAKPNIKLVAVGIKLRVCRDIDGITVIAVEVG